MLARSSWAFVLLFAGCATDPRARFKEISGGDRWDSVAVIQTKGTLSVGGLSGAYESTEDARDGRRASRYSLGAFTGAEGFDGEHGWRQSAGGEVLTPDSEEERALERTQQ